MALGGSDHGEVNLTGWGILLKWGAREGEHPDQFAH